HGLMPDFMMAKFVTMEVRADFGPVYLVNFAAAALGLAWLLIAGPHHKSPTVQKLAAAVTWVFTLKFLQLLGRHSLHVYVWHVAIVYAVYYIDAYTPDFSQVTKTLIAFAAIALLAIPALWRERDRLFSSGQKVAAE
ncbi:OpgC domain-containing protein, partial [Pseudomonas sp. SB113]